MKGSWKMKTRQDAWTEENDLLLAETVLRHVREGSTQLNAFEEVGDKLNRTSAACGFRWNAVVRHQYEKALELAKKQRKQRQRLLGKEQGGKKKLLYQPPTTTLEDLGIFSYAKDEEMNTSTKAIVKDPENRTEQKQEESPTINHGQMELVDVIAYLEKLNSMQLHTGGLKSENERLKLENNELRKENNELSKKVEELEKSSKTMQEDYETLMKIMNRARNLVLFEEEERPATSFKMDRNGNLEKMAE